MSAGFVRPAGDSSTTELAVGQIDRKTCLERLDLHNLQLYPARSEPHCWTGLY